jgi:hypothetical protein
MLDKRNHRKNYLQLYVQIHFLSVQKFNLLSDSIFLAYQYVFNLVNH